MNTKQLTDMKARCEAEDYTDGRKLTLCGPELDAMYKQLKHARTDLPTCIKEIERKNQALQEIVTESGKVDINNWPAQQQICQSIARKALEDE